MTKEKKIVVGNRESVYDKPLIDQRELIEAIWRSDCSTRQKIEDIILQQPVVAVERTIKTIVPR